MCKIKFFICDPVSVTKKLRPLQAKIKYQCAHNNGSYLQCYFENLFMREKSKQNQNLKCYISKNLRLLEYNWVRLCYF